MQQTLSIKERIDDGEIEIEELKESVMHERQAINPTSGSSSMNPKSFSMTLRSSVGDVHVVTLPAHISTADQTNTCKLDSWSRFNGFPEFEDINQLEPRLVESRLSIIDRQDRILEAQLNKIKHDRKSMKADVRKYDELVEYLGKCDYGDDKNVVSKSDIIADGEFLLDEKAAEKMVLDELLEKVNALKSQVEYRVKKLVQGITQMKTEYALQGEEDEAKVCLRNLLMKIGPFGTSLGGTKIPIMSRKIEYDKHELQGEEDEAKVCLRNQVMKIGPFGTRLGGTKIPIMSRKIEYDKHGLQGEEYEAIVCLRNQVMKKGPFGTRLGGTKIPIMSRKIEYDKHGLQGEEDEAKVCLRNQVMKNKYTSKRNDKNTYTQSQDTNRRYKDIKSKLNTGSKCVEREVGKASLEQSIASSKIAAKKKQVEDDVRQRGVFKQDEGGKGRDSTHTKRRKVIKSKIDTGRKNAVRHQADKDMKNKVTALVSVGNKQANASDMKTRNEGQSSFSNKPLLPQIKSVTQENDVIKGQHVSEKRNGNNKLAPLPKVRGRGHDFNDLINQPGVRNEALTPLSFNHERSTPLPPIKSALRDNDNMITGIKEDYRNAGVKRVSFAPSPPPRAQPSPLHIIDSAERTQHRA